MAPVVNPGEICLSITNVLDLGCIANELPNIGALCVTLSGALASTVIGAPIAAKILAGCTVLVAGLELYCNTFGVSPPGGPSISEQICNSPAINRNVTNDVILTPWAPGLPSTIYGLSERVSGSGPYPLLGINLGSQTAIRKLDLNPAVPVVFQSYFANVDVFCLQAGSTVTISVVGTDGYTDSMIYPITVTQSDGTFTLSVPGAASAGVQDVVTLQIALPNGTIITRTASLVFV